MTNTEKTEWHCKYPDCDAVDTVSVTDYSTPTPTTTNLCRKHAGPQFEQTDDDKHFPGDPGFYVGDDQDQEQK